MGRRKARSTKPEAILPPPPEQMSAGAFVLTDIIDKRQGGGAIAIGKAYRRRPMIDILMAQGLFTAEEHKALRHYRHHADLVDRSPVRDSLCLQRGGSGAGPTLTMLSACRLVGGVEAAAGSLKDILRAIVVDDWSLSQWAIQRHGGVEIKRERNGKAATAMEPRHRALVIAKQEMKIAAQRVEAELSAG